MKAIVFDNAGTIIKRVSVLKDILNDNFIFETNTIDIVNKNNQSLILVFQIPTKMLIKNEGRIYDFIVSNKDSFEISYSTEEYTKDDVIKALRYDNTSFSDIKDSAITLINKYDIEICSGSALIVNMKKSRIDYAYTAGGIFFEDALNLFNSLKKRGYQLYIASGDNKNSLLKISSILKIPADNVFDTCNIRCKCKVIKKLQEKYEKVLMVGNNTNDFLAIKQANIGILSIEQGEVLPKYLEESSDYIISKLGEVLKIVNEEF